MEDRKIRVAITHGDTNGIGYELIFKAFSEPEMLELCTPIIYGSPKIAAYHRKAMDLQANFSIINNATDAQDGRVNMLTCFDGEVKVELGTPTKESGDAALKALDKAMTDFRSQHFDVLVTCPAYAQTMNADNYSYKGLKSYAETSIGEGAKGVKMMINESVRIALATDGLAVKDIAANITIDNILDKVRKLHNSMKRDFRISNPRIAVLALNPNADGTEEKEVLIPAIRKAEEEGINAYGPYPAEEFFGQNMCDAFDVTLAMYDDQGMIPFTTLMQNDGIFYITSLPLVCTAPALTPDFENAGKGIADENALRHANYTATDATVQNMTSLWTIRFPSSIMRRETKARKCASPSPRRERIRATTTDSRLSTTTDSDLMVRLILLRTMRLMLLQTPQPPMPLPRNLLQALLQKKT